MTELFTFCVIGGATLATQFNDPRKMVALIAIQAITCLGCFANRILWSKA